MSTSAINRPDEFCDYLKEAFGHAMETEGDGELGLIHDLCRRGVRVNRAALSPERFLKAYLWCVGSIQKTVEANEAYFPQKMTLFRQCNPAQIVRDSGRIWDEWTKEKCNLHQGMVKAMLTTAELVAGGWETFCQKYLPLPSDPESDRTSDWWPSYAALDRLPMVGDALAWYLLRNLYGAPFLKPDVHVLAIAQHFFGAAADPVAALGDAIRKQWASVCKDDRFLPVHLGEVDYVLWWYRRSTGEPQEVESSPESRRGDKHPLALPGAGSTTPPPHVGNRAGKRKRFYVVVPGDEGGSELYPMKEWLRDHPEHNPFDVDPKGKTSHQLRDGLKKKGWKVEEIWACFQPAE